VTTVSDMLSKVEALLDDCLTTIRVQYTGMHLLLDYELFSNKCWETNRCRYSVLVFTTANLCMREMF